MTIFSILNKGGDGGRQNAEMILIYFTEKIWCYAIFQYNVSGNEISGCKQKLILCKLYCKIVNV